VESKLQKTVKVEKEGKTKEEQETDVVSIFYHNIQSINCKLLELKVILQTHLAEVDVLCLSEHWLQEEYIKLISIDEFQLASNFSRSKSSHGGSCIYIKHYMQTKEVNYPKGISKEKDFEVTTVEIQECELIIVCLCVCV